MSFALWGENMERGRRKRENCLSERMQEERKKNIVAARVKYIGGLKEEKWL
jgi:hypothetical protein